MTAEVTMRRVVRFKAAAHEASVTIPTIRNYVKDGILDLIRIQGKKRSLGISRESLDRLIEQSTIRNSRPTPGAKPNKKGGAE